jgi:hypothetical protein
MLPASWGHAAAVLPLQLHETILVTVHPDHVAPAILAPIDVVVAIGHSPEKTLGDFAVATSRTIAWPEDLVYQADRVVVWLNEDGQAPFAMQAQPGRAERIRHHRKYAEGNLRWHSFYFRGPDNHNNLKAQNLVVFCQLAQGIDESTWMYHLRRGDYSRWFRHAIKDDHLADETERIERRPDLEPWQTRQMIREFADGSRALAMKCTGPPGLVDHFHGTHLHPVTPRRDRSMRSTSPVSLSLCADVIMKRKVIALARVLSIQGRT